MATLYKEEVENTPSSSVYFLHPGSFQVMNSDTGWIGCRVSFHEAWYKKWVINNKQKNFYYCSMSWQTPQIVTDSITQAEECLALPEEDRCKIWPVKARDIPANNRTIAKGEMFIEPSDWWIDPIRWTFLTALCRSASTDKLKDLIKKGLYFSTTQAATEKFLEKNTFYQGETFGGWVVQFSQSDQAHLLSNKPVKRDAVQVSHHPGWSWYAIPLCKR
jgi:hypothetical protein